ncbi:transcriptional regulator [Halarchaeum grantii]|uniref:Transcriptional regulator n=1 Tax=Halarchaeum grantii TaxID=1193105 RepID=A0A830FCY6_9EURY|nr:helix-turn-helix domain-containing protein [Halarchaeum grantii]GGL42313.1 transcriptional regulator [Halarchaeum grantii]
MDGAYARRDPERTRAEERAPPESRDGGVEPSPREVTAALDDADCRAMLAALEEAKTARELREECDVPSSTAYRKLDRLSDAGLVTERVTLDDGYQQVTRYVRAFDAVRLSADADGFSVDIEVREQAVTDRPVGPHSPTDP